MDEPRSNSSSVQVSYPAYPTLQPIASNPPASSYAQYTGPAQQDYSQGHNHYDQGSQPSSYQQQVHQQPQQQQQQPYQPIVGDMNGSRIFAPPFTDPTGQQLVQVQSSYQQVNPCMHCCLMLVVLGAACCYTLLNWLTCRGVIGGHA